jgi:hypothetical protein
VPKKVREECLDVVFGLDVFGEPGLFKNNTSKHWYLKKQYYKYKHWYLKIKTIPAARAHFRDTAWSSWSFRWSRATAA